MCVLVIWVKHSSRVVDKSRQPAKFASLSARFHRLLSLLQESRYVEEMMSIRSTTVYFSQNSGYLKTEKENTDSRY